MLDELRRGAAFVAYQLVLAIGILAMPVALGARRLGLTLPIGRLVESAERAYRNGSRCRAVARLPSAGRGYGQQRWEGWHLSAVGRNHW